MHLFGELDLEGVVLIALGSGNGEVGRLPEGLGGRGLPGEGVLGLRRAPGLVGDAAEGEASGLDGVAVHLEAELRPRRGRRRSSGDREP